MYGHIRYNQLPVHKNGIIINESCTPTAGGQTFRLHQVPLRTIYTSWRRCFVAVLGGANKYNSLTADGLPNQQACCSVGLFLLLGISIQSYVPARLVFDLSFVHVVEQSVEGEVAAKSIFLRCPQRSFRDAAVRPEGAGQTQRTSSCRCITMLLFRTLLRCQFAPIQTRATLTQAKVCRFVVLHRLFLRQTITQ